jgi:ABC-type transporter Mla maintaining outer membrane lipid asymmetry ATPase subunit MlaF
LLVDHKLLVGSIDRLTRSRNPWVHEFLHGPRAQGVLRKRR